MACCCGLALAVVSLQARDADERQPTPTTTTAIPSSSQQQQQVTLVSNSIGTISAFQALLDQPELYTGCFVVCPNFRELHSAEVAFSNVAMPILRRVQAALRKYGQTAFDAAATPQTVQQILQEPYAVTSAVDEQLVQVLLDPLLTPGASQVVFDTLSYSAGPLPEQQLQQFPQNKPVWVVYGDSDPWTPGPRVERLTEFGTAVERVVSLPGIGHCPHDEAPELVHPLLHEFMQRVRPTTAKSSSTRAAEPEQQEQEQHGILRVRRYDKESYRILEIIRTLQKRVARSRQPWRHYPGHSQSRHSTSAAPLQGQICRRHGETLLRKGSLHLGLYGLQSTNPPASPTTLGVGRKCVAPNASQGAVHSGSGQRIVVEKESIFERSPGGNQSRRRRSTRRNSKRRSRRGGGRRYCFRILRARFLEFHG
mmetsp:Transcript_6342/g.17863  ORF Transcript_6342/g.17863 Transcript_6342/m.17863 type:complete len:424 (-) Transcript_6342:653-1924(-)